MVVETGRRERSPRVCGRVVKAAVSAVLLSRLEHAAPRAREREGRTPVPVRPAVKPVASRGRLPPPPALAAWRTPSPGSAGARRARSGSARRCAPSQRGAAQWPGPGPGTAPLCDRGECIATFPRWEEAEQPDAWARHARARRRARKQSQQPHAVAHPSRPDEVLRHHTISRNVYRTEWTRTRGLNKNKYGHSNLGPVNLSDPQSLAHGQPNEQRNTEMAMYSHSGATVGGVNA